MRLIMDFSSIGMQTLATRQRFNRTLRINTLYSVDVAKIQGCRGGVCSITMIGLALVQRSSFLFLFVLYAMYNACSLAPHMTEMPLCIVWRMSGVLISDSPEITSHVYTNGYRFRRSNIFPWCNCFFLLSNIIHFAIWHLYWVLLVECIE